MLIRARVRTWVRFSHAPKLACQTWARSTPGHLAQSQLFVKHLHTKAPQVSPLPEKQMGTSTIPSITSKDKFVKAADTWVEECCSYFSVRSSVNGSHSVVQLVPNLSAPFEGIYPLTDDPSFDEIYQTRNKIYKKFPTNKFCAAYLNFANLDNHCESFSMFKSPDKLLAILCIVNAPQTRSLLFLLIRDCIRFENKQLLQQAITFLISVNALDSQGLLPILRGINEHKSPRLIDSKSNLLWLFVENTRSIDLSLDTWKSKMFVFLVQLLINERQLLLAATICMTSSDFVDAKTVTHLIENMLPSDPVFDVLYIDTIKKLIEKHNLKLSVQNQIRLLEKPFDIELKESSQFPFLANDVYKFVDFDFDSIKKGFTTIDDLDTKSKSLFIRAMDVHKELLLFNIKHENMGQVHSIWNKITKFHSFFSEDFELLSKLIKAFTRNRRYHETALEIVNLIPLENFKNPLIYTSVLSFSGATKNFELSKLALENIQYPLTRSAMFALLHFYCQVNDSDSVRNILSELFETAGQLKSPEFNEVIRFLLRQGLYKEALNMIMPVSVEVCADAIVTFIDHYVVKRSRQANASIDWDAVEKLVNKLMGGYNEKALTRKSVLRHLSIVYLQYILNNYDTETALRIYKISALQRDEDINNKRVPWFYKTEARDPGLLDLYVQDLDHQNQFERYFMVMPFREPQEVVASIVLYIPDKVKVLALRQISNKAKQRNKLQHSMWCYRELMKLGVAKEEIVSDYSKDYKGKGLRATNIESLIENL